MSLEGSILGSFIIDETQESQSEGRDVRIEAEYMSSGVSGESAVMSELRRSNVLAMSSRWD
jgi:hypothetical protein